ncbi:hypothetical protein D3C75_754790 [compost metagenome]
MWIADAGHRVHGLACAKVVEGTPFAAAQVDQRGGLQLEGKSIIAVGHGTVVEDRVDALQALDRLTQRPGRQATAIAQATGGVDQHQFQVTGHAVVLHAVVGQDQIQRLTGQQGFDGVAAIGVDHQRDARALDDQQRLVTGDVGALLGLDSPWQLRRFGAVAAADHADPQAAALAVLDHPQNQRCLAGATHGDVADHDQRHRWLIDLALSGQKALALVHDHAPVQPFQRLQQFQGRMTCVPRGEQSIGHGHQDAGGAASTVVMRKWLKPSLPAASMAVMTD